MDRVHPLALQGVGEGAGLVQVPAPLHPVGGGDADQQRPALRPDRPHGAHHLQRKPHAPGQVAAMGVVAPVGERREELVQQVAVGAMHLERVEADGGRPHRGRGEVLDHLGEALGVQRRRRRPAVVVGHGRGADGAPRRLPLAQRRAALPGAPRARLAPGMAELHADPRRPDRAAEGRHPLHLHRLRLVPEAGAAVGDPPLGRDAGRLDQHEAGPGHRHLPEMDVVPLGHPALDGGVLAHRRDDDAIGQVQRAEGDRLEQGDGHGRRLLAGRGAATRPRGNGTAPAQTKGARRISGRLGGRAGRAAGSGGRQPWPVGASRSFISSRPSAVSTASSKRSASSSPATEMRSPTVTTCGPVASSGS